MSGAYIVKTIHMNVGINVTDKTNSITEHVETFLHSAPLVVQNIQEYPRSNNLALSANRVNVDAEEAEKSGSHIRILGECVRARCAAQQLTVQCSSVYE